MMKSTTLLLAVIAFLSLNAQAQLHALEDGAKSQVSVPINIECGSAFWHPGGSVELFHATGHHVTISSNRAQRRVTVTRDGGRWTGHIDDAGNLHIVDPQGVESIRSPLSIADAQMYAAMTRSQFLALTSPCESVAIEGPKCLDNHVFSHPAPDDVGPFSPPNPQLSRPKGCIPDYWGDAGYWSVQLMPYFPGADSMTFELTQQQLCQQQKSACMQACGDAMGLSAVACAAVAVASPVAGVACAAGALVLYQSCEGHCSSAFTC